MRYELDTLKSSMPTLNKSYSPFDIIGQTIGRYFDYKVETEMIRNATEQLKYKTEVIIKDIDAQLQKALDENDKNFRLEMKRLKVVAKDLKENRKNQKRLIKHIEELTSNLSNPTIPLEVKQSIPQLIAIAHQNLLELHKNRALSMDSMGSSKNSRYQLKG